MVLELHYFGLEWTTSSIEKSNCLIILNLCLKLPREIFVKNFVKKGGIISKNFTVGCKFIWQVIYIYQKKKGPYTDPWGTPDLISFHEEVYPFIPALRLHSCIYLSKSTEKHLLEKVLWKWVLKYKLKFYRTLSSF